MPYLELVGIRSAALIRTFDLRYDLTSTLVERWRSETHTFHLPCGECTITLEDVALQLGLPIDGSAVKGDHSYGGDDLGISHGKPFFWCSSSAFRALLEFLTAGIFSFLISASQWRIPLHFVSLAHQPLTQWSIYSCIERSYIIPIYRLMIEQYAGEEFIWMPYRRQEIMAIIPSSAYIDSQLWCTNAPTINFNVVKWYHGDRVPQQFGYIQYIPDPPM
ncbi:hypothetical protein PVK06_031420 [Gossypium arboreum]|uniref:Aminotransferase-like plant mobile domain-containing protein n=1 Tax=Gossypium arboreum TaxID=29729 RepID=A0ABR0NS17_GOSAR|nr:hypothetical protein PVK06_031420 [Gossypium arboreum]